MSYRLLVEPGAQRRLFNGVGLTSRVADRLDVLAQFDLGAQQRQDSVTAMRTNHVWYGATLVGRLWVRPTVALSAPSMDTVSARIAMAFSSASCHAASVITTCCG